MNVREHRYAAAALHGELADHAAEPAAITVRDRVLEQLWRRLEAGRLAAHQGLIGKHLPRAKVDDGLKDDREILGRNCPCEREL
jgi:hypothetical protein